MLHAHLAALALAAGTLAGAGCGSSVKSGSTNASAARSGVPATAQPSTTAATTPTIAVASGKPLSRAQWIARGDAICARLVTQLAGTTAKTQPELARALTQSAAYARASVTQLAKLVPPASKETDWQEYLTGLQDMVADSVSLARIAQSGILKSNLPIMTTSQAIHKRIEALAKHDGFKSCAQV